MISAGAGRESSANQSFFRLSRSPNSMCWSLPIPVTRIEKPRSRLTRAASRKALGVAMNSATLSAGIRLLLSTSLIAAIFCGSRSTTRLSIRKTPPSAPISNCDQRFSNWSGVEPSPKLGLSIRLPSGNRVAMTPIFSGTTTSSLSKWLRSIRIPLRAAVCSSAIIRRLAASPRCSGSKFWWRSQAIKPINSAGVSR
ncbi:hypothetical protein D3C77_468220 [compost metagenome]